MASTSKPLPVEEDPGSTCQYKLNCPLCLNVYKTPRSLLCLHTFCEECIHFHILHSPTSEAVECAIICPVCKTETPPDSPGMHRAEWARLLPESYLLQHGLETTADTAQVCENCSSFGKTSPAKTFCKNCRQVQCETCAEIHSLVASMRDHTLISVEDRLTMLNLGKLEYCQHHNDKEVNYFCEDDNALCCLNCAFSHHRTCKNVQEISDLVPSLMTGDLIGQLQNRMFDLNIKIDEINSGIDNNVLDISKQADDIPKTMAKVMDDIVDILEKLVAMVNQKCDLLKKQHTTEMEKQITDGKRLDAAIASSMSLLESTLKLGSDTQKFIVLRKLKEQIVQYEATMRAIETTNRVVQLHVTLSEDLNKIVQTGSEFPTLDAIVTAELVVPVPKQVSITECTTQVLPMFVIGKRDHYQQPEYRGIAYLIDGRLVAVDFRNDLCCLLADNFSVLAEVKLPSSPIDLAVIDPNEVFVALPDSKRLQCVRITGNTMELSNSINCKRAPYSITRVSDTDLVVGWETGISRISSAGEEKQVINKDSTDGVIKFSYADCVAAEAGGNRVFRSRFSDNAVFCLDLSGEVKFSYKDAIQPCGIALDRDRNVYICCRGTNTIHQVSPAGNLLSIIDPGIKYPYTVCFNQAGDTMTLTNLNIYGGNTNTGLRIQFVPRKNRDRE